MPDGAYTSEDGCQAVEMPQLQAAAAAIAGAPAFASALASQISAFTAAVGALPGACASMLGALDRELRVFV